MKQSPAKPGPHINLTSGEGDGEWFKWLLLIVIAVATGVGGFFLMPVLSSLKLLP